MKQPSMDPFLDELAAMLRLRPGQRRDIRVEIEDHIASQLAELLDSGLTYEQATARILADFGDAADLARRFGMIGQRRRWIMRSTLAASFVIATTVVTSFLMPAQRGNPFAPAHGGAAAPDSTGSGKEGGQGVPVVRDEDPSDAAVRAALEKMCPEVNYESQPLESGIEYLRELSGVNIVVDWSSLEAAAIERDRSISLKLKNVSLGATLRAILNQAGANEVKLDYQVRDGILTVATAEALAQFVEVRLYGCGDLFRLPPPRWVQAEVDRSLKKLFDPPSQTTTGRGGTPGGGAVVAGRVPDADEITEAVMKRRTVELVNVIQNTIDSESWKNNGGGVGSITLFDDVLVIVQTPRNHEAIDQLIRNLIRARSGGAGQ